MWHVGLLWSSYDSLPMWFQGTHWRWSTWWSTWFYAFFLILLNVGKTIRKRGDCINTKNGFNIEVYKLIFLETWDVNYSHLEHSQIQPLRNFFGVLVKFQRQTIKTQTCNDLQGSTWLRLDSIRPPSYTYMLSR